MGRALIVSAGASSNEYISARLTELGYARPIIVPVSYTHLTLPTT